MALKKQKNIFYAEGKLKKIVNKVVEVRKKKGMSINRQNSWLSVK